MNTGRERDAKMRARHLSLFRRGIITSDELFTALLDTFADGFLLDDLAISGEEVCKEIGTFLTNHVPVSFKVFLIGQQPTPEAALKWEQERRRKYADLLAILGVSRL
jgi:hypothetical protein